MTSAEALDAMIGRRFGGAVVVRLIGTGGMGAVYEAENPLLGRRYAVKVVLPELASKPLAVERFLQEGRAAAAILHPRIVPIIDCGYTEDGRPFQIMPLLDGRNLNQHCDEVGAERGHRGRLPVELAAPLFFQILDGLAAAHGRQIVHRDLKGGNIHVLEDGTIKILDFGIAKLFNRELRVVARTDTFQIIGTPGYMAPEQARGGAIDYRTDLWSLGAVFFRVLTGRLPFEGSDPIEIAAKAMLTPAPTATELVPEVPARLSGVLLACLAPDPNGRPNSARVLAHQLMDAVPGGRAIAQQVAPDLMAPSGPNDPTIRPPVEPAKPALANAIGSKASGSTRTITRDGAPGARPVPAHSTLQLPRAGRPRVWFAALFVLAGAALGVTIMFAAKRGSPRAPSPAKAPAASPGVDRSAPADIASQPPRRDPRTGQGSAGARFDASLVPSSTRDAGVSPTPAGISATRSSEASAKQTMSDSRPKSSGGARGRRRSRAESGTLVIKANPFADVSIDGKSVGSTPLSRELGVGRHHIELVGPDGKSESQEVTIRAGRTTRLERNWRQEK